MATSGGTLAVRTSPAPLLVVGAPYALHPAGTGHSQSSHKHREVGGKRPGEGLTYLYGHFVTELVTGTLRARYSDGDEQSRRQPNQANGRGLHGAPKSLQGGSVSNLHVIHS